MGVCCDVQVGNLGAASNQSFDCPVCDAPINAQSAFQESALSAGGGSHAGNAAGSHSGHAGSCLEAASSTKIEWLMASLQAIRQDSQTRCVITL